MNSSKTVFKLVLNDLKNAAVDGYLSSAEAYGDDPLWPYELELQSITCDLVKEIRKHFGLSIILPDKIGKQDLLNIIDTCLECYKPR